MMRTNAHRPPREPWPEKNTAPTRQEREEIQRQIGTWFATPNEKQALKFVFLSGSADPFHIDVSNRRFMVVLTEQPNAIQTPQG